MSDSDRRKFLRVLFEANFEVCSSEWTEKEVTGLDISLNGCRFNCKKSISDGEILNIIFKPGLELEGIVRWCWPIEWYFQAALHFEDIAQEKQAKLKSYIEEVTGKDYLMQKDEEMILENTDESVEILQDDLDDIDDLSASIVDVEDQEKLTENTTEEDEMEDLTPLEEEDLLNLDIEEPIDKVSDFSDLEEKQVALPKNAIEEDELEELPPLEEEDLLNIDVEEDSVASETYFSNTKQEGEFYYQQGEVDISTQSFAGKNVVLYDLVKDQSELLIRYLSERSGMEVECVTKKVNLWRLLKIDPIDMVIIETGTGSNSEALEVILQTKAQFPEIKFICISGPVSLEKRLQYINAGAHDYLIRPVHLSTIAQSVLVHLSRSSVGDSEEDTNLQREMMDFNDEFQEDLNLTSEQRDEEKSETKELDQRSQQLEEEKESIFLEETFIPDEESITDSAEIDPVEDLKGKATLLDEDLKISEEIDLIDEDY